MKLKHLILPLILSLGSLTAQECCLEVPEPVQPRCFCDANYQYLKLGGAGIGVGSRVGGGISVGYGRRIVDEHLGLDLSTALMIGPGLHDALAYTFLIPHARFLYYLEPYCARGFYFGLGGAWGRTNTSKHRFWGFYTTASVGYDIRRGRRLHNFIELEYIQPTIKTCTAKNITYAPSLSLTMGIGF